MDRGERIQQVVRLVETHGHRCALVGGIAVSIRVRERFTKDIDFAVAVESDAEAEALALVREQDRADLRVLVAAASARELELARDAVRLIETRGFSRGKRLEEVLAAFVQGRR